MRRRLVLTPLLPRQHPHTRSAREANSRLYGDMQRLAEDKRTLLREVRGPKRRRGRREFKCSLPPAQSTAVSLRDARGAKRVPSPARPGPGPPAEGGEGGERLYMLDCLRNSQAMN